MVSTTCAYRQRSLAPNHQRRMPRATARAIEIQLPIDDPKTDRTLCRIFILSPGVTATKPLVDQMRAAANTHTDEELTWEDAEWL
jgi:UDP-N-acetylmuramoylalanine-D-glutamate ligase